MGSPPQRLVWRPSRPLHFLQYRLVLVILIICLIQQQRLYFIYHNALATKYSPTIFNPDFEEPRAHLHRLDDEDAQFQQYLLSNRPAWRVLGSGWEGTTFTYNDTVIKTFAPGKSPFRNCAPMSANEKWPTEIPASVYFGGSSLSTSYKSCFNGDANSTGFLPVEAYFMASSSPTSPPAWHLVTPLVAGGNLNTLAKTVKGRPNPSSFRDVDALYRPTFNRLLRTLESMHSANFCHDDIKPSNIFVQDDSRWLLGDLGNVRHVSQPYHSSLIWTDNRQLTDCRANDAIRALKSYLQFVRAASMGTDAFDAEFFERREPLSRLFWWALANAHTLRADGLRKWAFVETPSQSPTDGTVLTIPHSVEQQSLLGMVSPKQRARAREVGAALRMGLSERRARWLAMTWLFGVPSTGC
ncbi:hypothetical protein BU26DRAFT_238175 [Trematosphaeria pertusa]|uniref:Protein kinase domain-containing protein n=1 Tax=Trematosphaeria pertusa TaxID=390896 RepID=A0A6A6HQ79_9PLEO|nr:uncharacterized protein BU26DRAFT_238175 [Trematosphaeria pertusa]KAF2240304.1 hypothetical protein BU26DRAFT_238175 [Trematosphaeria pertusa]